MSENQKSLITLVLCERDTRGNKTGRSKTFESTSGEEVRSFYDSNKGLPKRPKVQKKDEKTEKKKV